MVFNPLYAATYREDTVCMEDRWLSMAEICEYVGTRNDTIQKWIKTKGFPAVKVGRFWKFKKEKVDAWMESFSNKSSFCKNVKRQKRDADEFFE